MICTVGCKQNWDWYEHLQDLKDKMNSLTNLRSGIEWGALSNLNGLLAKMEEAMEDIKHEKNAKKEKVARRGKDWEETRCCCSNQEE